MALTISEILRAVNPNVGLVDNSDTPTTYRLTVEDVNSDEILAALNLVRRQPVITPTTGATAVVATLTPGAAFKLLGIRFHLSSALAAGETITVTADDGAGAAYDTLLYSQDLGTDDIRDVVLDFDSGSDFYNAADSIVIALSANAGTDTWAIKTIHELV